MASRRMIDPGFWKSKAVAGCTPFERLLYLGMVSLADDQGRMLCHPAAIRSCLFPYDDIPLDDMARAIQSLYGRGFILIYDADGRPALQVVDWWDWQRPRWARPSRFAAPEGWQDRICFCAGTKVTRINWPVSADTIWRQIRRAIFKRDSHTCRYCGARAQHVDHIVPRSQGGSDELDNLVASCARCNLSKGGRTPEQAGMELI